MPDRAEGGTYINNRVELVVHRIIHSNDGRGINEQLQEMERILLLHKYINMLRRKTHPTQGHSLCHLRKLGRSNVRSEIY